MKKELCLRCKGGKFLCGISYCPIIVKNKALAPIRRILPSLKNEYYGPSPPSIFVGRFGYPKVYIGPMGAINWDNIEIMDEPDKWKTDLTLENVIDIRAKLFRFMGEPINVSDISSSSKILEVTQEQIQANNPIDLEIKFSRKPKIDLSFNNYTQPLGVRFKIDSLKLVSNPKINTTLEKVVNDTDLNALIAVDNLYQSKYSVTQISRVLSAGLLGEKNKRKFVPTRWSITATDDIIGNSIRERISTFKPLEEFLVFHNSYLDNDFWTLFIPKDFWQFNYHESWKQGSSWNPSDPSPEILTDNEGPNGRKYYATNTVGGYYAARLAILEKLEQLKRVSSVVTIREVGKGYVIPLGVWQVRENMRKSLIQPHAKFTSLIEALKYIENQLTVPLNYYYRRSPILNRKTLDDFFMSLKQQSY